MATYRLAAQVVRRSRGDRVVAKAAYRAGVALRDERYGETYDYSRRGGVAHAEIVLPSGAAAGYASRERLWNAVEAREVRRDAQLAHELQLSLPHELTLDEWLELMRGFAQEAFVAAGLPVDFAVHVADREADPRNVHAHLLVPQRELVGRSFGEKSRLWTPEFGAGGGARYVSDASRLVELRGLWAAAVNRALDRARVPARVSHLSYAARGIDREPEPKLGPLATDLERRGIETLAGDDRRAVWERNAERELRRALEKVQARSQGRPESYEEQPRVTIAGPRAARRRENDLLLRMYGKRDMAKVGLAGWQIRRRIGGGLEFVRAGSSAKVLDKGADIFGTSGDAEEIRSMLALSEAKGWRVLKFSGSPEFKLAAMTAAYERGFEVDAVGADVALAERARRAASAELGQRSGRGGAGPTRDASVAAPSPEAPGSAPAPAAEPQTPELIVQRVLTGLTWGESTFSQRALDRALARYAREHEGIELDALLEAARVSPAIVQTGVVNGSPIYTTRVVRDAERELFDDVVAMSQRRAFPTTRSFVDEIAAERGVEGDQLAALHHVTGPEAATVVEGLAGTGKSFMLGLARESWEHDGYEVEGVALAGIAAEGLEEGSGIRSRTLASALLAWESDPGAEPREPLSEKTVIVLDEAGMVGHPDYQRLVRVAQRYGAKLVSVGDFEQLQTIERGSPFRGLIERIGAARIESVRRQREPWMREATVELARARTREALARYDGAGATHREATLAGARTALVSQWVADRTAFPPGRTEDGRLTNTQIVLAFTNDDTESLNLALQARRREAGELGASVHATVTIGSQGKTRRVERDFAIGDRVYFLETKKDLSPGVSVKNGSLGVIADLEGSGGELRLVVDLDNGKRTSFSLAQYARLDLGYAATVNKAQGVTVDRAYCLATHHWNRHLTYVGMSRHRESVQLYWSDDEFRSVAQRDRVLGRRALKSNALDVEVERETSRETYLRTPEQLQREFDGALAMARHLEQVAPETDRAAAERGLAATKAWHSAQMRALERVREAGIATLEVARHQDQFGERIAHLEAALAGAVEEIAGRAPAPEVEASALETGKMEEEQAPPGARILQPVDAERYIESATRMLQSTGYISRIAGLVALTGRRPYEVVKQGELRSGFEPHTALFAGQAMTRDEDRVRESYEIPILGDRDLVLRVAQELREELALPSRSAGVPLVDLDARGINDRIGKTLRDTAKAALGMGPQDLRAAYAALAHAQYGGVRDAFDYYSEILGNATPEQALTYMKFAPAGQEDATLRAILRGRTRLVEELRAQMAGVDDETARGYLRDRIARLEAVAFSRPVPSLDFTLHAVQPEVFTARIDGLLRSARYNDVAVGIMGATGARLIDVLRDARLQVDDRGPQSLVMTREGRAALHVPSLLPPGRVIDALAKVREARDFSALGDEALLARVREQVQASMGSAFGGGVSGRDVRGMYAAVAADRTGENLTPQYVAQVLGLDATSPTLLHEYARYYTGNAEVARAAVAASLSQTADLLRARAAQERELTLRDVYLERAAALGGARVDVGDGVRMPLAITQFRGVAADVERRTELIGQIAAERGDLAAVLRDERTWRQLLEARQAAGRDEQEALRAQVSSRFGPSTVDYYERLAEIQRLREMVAQLEAVRDGSREVSIGVTIDGQLEVDDLRAVVASLEHTLSADRDVASSGPELSLGR